MYECECKNEKHYVGEYGTKIYIDCGEDVSLATSVYVMLKRPDDTILQRTATPTTFEGSTNFVVMTLQNGDLNQIGTKADPYIGQVFMNLLSWVGRGKKFTLEVEEAISSSSSSSSKSAAPAM